MGVTIGTVVVALPDTVAAIQASADTAIGSCLVLLLVVWLLLENSARTLNCSVAQLTTSNARIGTTHALAWEPPLARGAH